MEQESEPTTNSSSTPQNPQATQQPSQISSEYKPAGFRLRYLAYFIDNLVFALGVMGPLAILSLLITFIAGNASFFPGKTGNNILTTVLPFVLFVIYLIFFTYRSGATPGKRYVGIKVISVLESRLSLKKVIVREVSKQLISGVLNLFGSLIIVIAFYFLIIRNIYGVLGILGGNGIGIFQHSSVTLILTAVSIVLVYFLISIFIYYKVFFSLKAGKRGIQDWLAGTRVIVVKPMSRAKKIWLGVLIFLIVLIPIIGIFAAVALIAINPARQFAEANNTQRSKDVTAIVIAIGQYRADHIRVMPYGIDATVRTISDSGVPLTVDLCAALVPTYFADIPVDPTIGVENPKNSVCTDPGADYNSGYTVVLDPVSNKITVSASGAELGETISATEPSYGVDQIDSTNNSTQKDDMSFKSDIDVISSELTDYYVAKNTFPSGLYTLALNRDPTALPSSSPYDYAYMTLPVGCAGNQESPCNRVAVYSQLSSPLIAGNIWCWRSNSREGAKEVSTSECIP